MSDEVLVTVGRIAKAHGLKGEVSVEAWTDDPDDRFQVGTVFTTEAAASPAVVAPAPPATLTVASARVHAGRWLLSFEEIADRTAVETLRGTRLLLEARARRVLDDPDDFYDSDLTNLQARTPAGEVIGPVTDVVPWAGRGLHRHRHRRTRTSGSVRGSTGSDRRHRRRLPRRRRPPMASSTCERRLRSEP